MRKTYLVGDVEFNKSHISNLTDIVIGMRDIALEKAAFEWAVQLSYIVGILKLVQQDMEE